ncbi:hypothetical protein [Lactococcus lactis]|uniref:hypothetical protein n=1 Tax=Lactococcus lactis TaxID=1358 RepID=UPI001F53A6E3|nr:hypothetical protein [Lactococcus lactis]MCI1072268.1 hypothetical protein [Lactococcus lactis]
MMKKMVVLLLISGLVLVTPHAFATAGGFRGGGNRSTRTGGNFGGGNTNSHYNNTGSNSYTSILGHLEWGADIIEIAFLVGLLH